MSNRFVNPVLFVMLCLGLLIWQLSAPAFGQSQPQAALAGKSLLVLHAFEANMPINVKTDQGLMAALETGGLDVKQQFFEYMDLARNPGPEHRKHLAELMRLRYGQRNIDLIITLYAEPLQFVLNEGRNLFPKIPILALYLPPGMELPKTDRRIIQHSVRLDMIGTLQSALKLVPRAKRVYVVAGVYPGDKRYEGQARRDFQRWQGQLEFRYLSGLSLEDMLATVSSAPPGTIVFFIALIADITGKTFTPRDVVMRLSKTSAAPVFGLYDTLMGYGIAGGSLVSFERTGTQAGQLALDILRGTQTPENISDVLAVPPVPMFDWKQLKRWNLNEGVLPKGSIVINKETTLWSFRYYIIGALAFCLVETALIIILIAQRRRKKVAEERLLRKTEELDHFFNVSLDLLCIANTEGYFLRMNPTWERTLSFTREELMAKRFLDFVHPDDVESTLKAVSTLKSQKKVLLFENRYRCKDGSYRWLEWSSAPAGNLIYAAARDVTERKLVEEALEERLRFERLLSDISARFVTIPPDKVDSEIEYGLRQLLEFFQVDRCGLIRTLPGKSAYLITHVAYSEDVQPVPAGVELPISINPWSYEKLILKREVVAYSRPDDLPPEAYVDKQTWAEWSIRSNVCIPILIGEPVDHIISINSVKKECVWPEEFIPRLRLLGEIFVAALEHKRIEEEAFATRRELLRLDRLSRMGELTASLAHELNQPLTSILSNARAALRFIEKDALDKDELKEILQDIASDDKRAGDVIRSVRALVKTKEEEPELVTVNEVLREVALLFHSEAVIRNITVDVDLADSLPLVMISKVQFQQVVINLMMNAAESMLDVSDHRRITIRSCVENGMVQVAVCDFGAGIGEKDLLNIFEPFFTTKRSGLGLGLSLSRSIVEGHGGHIWARNNPDKGATFFFNLPGVGKK